MSLKKVLVTGGCGFIGSHLVDRLIEAGYFVTVIDNLSAKTTTEFLKHHIDRGRAEFFKYDIRNFNKLLALDRDYECIFHLAAQPDVKVSVDNPRLDFEVNTVGTFNILELMRQKDIKKMLFASSGGTVYGENPVFPTPETQPLRPISNYGAAKAACEMYCSSYSSLYELSITSLRLGNIFGPRSTHGVMFDFYNKLKKEPTRLEILGNGQQRKTYLYISDTVEAFILLYDHLSSGYDVFNVSSDETITVTEIARTIIEALNLERVRLEYTGGIRGWKGDVPYTSADITKLKDIGWKPRITIKEGIKKYINWLNEKERNQ